MKAAYRYDDRRIFFWFTRQSGVIYQLVAPPPKVTAVTANSAVTRYPTAGARSGRPRRLLFRRVAVAAVAWGQAGDQRVPRQRHRAERVASSASQQAVQTDFARRSPFSTISFLSLPSRIAARRRDYEPQIPRRCVAKLPLLRHDTLTTGSHHALLVVPAGIRCRGASAGGSWPLAKHDSTSPRAHAGEPYA